MPLSIGTELPIPFEPSPTRAYDYTYVEWVTPDFVAYPMTKPELGWFLAQGVAGLGSVPITMATDLMPAGGSRQRSWRPEARIMTLPTAITGNTPAQFQATEDQLEDAITRTEELGPGMMRFVRADGTERRIMCYYQAGFDSGGGDDWIYNVVPLQLWCPDGYFSDPTPTTFERSTASGSASPYYGPYRSVASSRIIGATTVTNRGQVVAWPLWTINGPFDQFSAILLNADGTDSTTLFTINPASSLSSSDVRIVDTTPGITSVTDAAGASKLGELVLPGSSLFGIPRGTTGIRFAATGSGAGTRVNMTFYPRFKKA
jgi:hypothetical protein